MINEALEKIRKEIANFPGARLVAVSKTKPAEAVLKLYEEGQIDFGENRVQELEEKRESLPDNIRWHLIGSLQKNKVKYVAPYVYMIHSCDNLDLAKVISKEALKQNRVIPVLLQIKIAEEDSKQGYDIAQLKQELDEGLIEQLPGISVHGVMGMATFTDDQMQVRKEFRQLKTWFEELRSKYFADKLEFKEISMGMSGDYLIALEEGATMVRIGSLLFGSR